MGCVWMPVCARFKDEPTKMTPNKVPQYTAFRTFIRGFQKEKIGLRGIKVRESNVVFVSFSPGVTATPNQCHLTENTVPYPPHAYSNFNKQ